MVESRVASKSRSGWAIQNYAARMRQHRDRAGAAMATMQAMALARTDAIMHRIVEGSFDAILTVTANGVIKTANQAACRMFDRRHRDIVGSRMAEMVPDFPNLVDPGSSHYAIGQGHRESTALRPYQREFPVDICLATTAIDGNALIVVIARDITEQREQRSILEHQAMHDALTGLPNRLLLRDRMHQAIAAAQRSRDAVALLLLDLDRFKQVNDTLGHHVGDLLLKDLAKRLMMPVRASDTVARLGGDEFAILLPHVDSVEHAHELAQRILSVFDQPFDVMEGIRLDVGCSIGVALYPDHSKDQHRLMQCADVAMYAAKHGGGSIVIYDPSKDSNSLRRLTLSSELRRALSSDAELSMVFQPKYDLHLDRVTGAEALCRWYHPELGPVSPDEFVLHAEQTGMIAELTRWTLESALREQARWRVGGLDVELAVNLSARMLHDEELPALLASIARSYDLPPEFITIEITESAIVLDPLSARTNACRLADHGFRLSIDDYGTGYSCLSFMQALPIKELKIDRTFVIDMLVNKASDVIVRSTIDLAHNLGMIVVAEGVETLEHVARLRELSVDIAQGYFIASPMERDAFANFLTSGKYRLRPSLVRAG